MTPTAAAFATICREHLADAKLPHDDAALITYLATMCLALNECVSAGLVRAKPPAVMPFKPRVVPL